MRARAASFVVRGTGPGRAARAALEAARGLDRPTGALIFASGESGAELFATAERLSKLLPGVPSLLVSGYGVLTERGELEGQSAVAGIVWTGGECQATVVEEERLANLGVALASHLAVAASASHTAFVFARPKEVAPHTLDPLWGLRFAVLVGGGTHGDRGVVAVNPGEAPRSGDAGALVLRGVTPPVVAVSPACKLLMPLGTITESRGPMVLTIDREPALEVLARVAKDLEDQPLVLVALSDEAEPADGRPALVLRGIQGVDPAVQGVLVSDEIRTGTRIAFAVRDAAMARQDLENATSRLARVTAGAAPCFGVYLTCAGRGTALYGAADVDVRILRARFPDLPIAGMHSAFEIAPHGGLPSMQLYTGVLALFSVPS